MALIAGVSSACPAVSATLVTHGAVSVKLSRDRDAGRAASIPLADAAFSRPSAAPPTCRARFRFCRQRLGDPLARPEHAGRQHAFADAPGRAPLRGARTLERRAR